MVTFIQTTNRNSFTLRYRKYKNLRYDFGDEWHWPIKKIRSQII